MALACFRSKPSGESTSAGCDALSINVAFLALAMLAGITALMRIECRDNSFDRLWVSALRPALQALYIAAVIHGRVEDTEEMFTTAPERCSATICSATRPIR